MLTYDLIVIGGGPAGTAAAITAARAEKRVLLLERGHLPRHKVCGEFISPEATGLLRDLLGPEEERVLTGAPVLSRSRLFVDAKTLAAPIVPPARSVPRNTLDAALWRVAMQEGCDGREGTAADEIRVGDALEVRSGKERWQAATVINASGRWSNLPSRDLPADAPRWLGIKAHFREALPPPSVDLYFFEGGYCGVQPIGKDAVNVCALVQANIARTLDQVFSRHPALWRRSRDWEAISEPVSTAPLIFRSPSPLGDGGVLNVGDAAGFIDPFAGDGIAVALRCGARAAVSSAEEYAAWYRREILPAFRGAARLRRLTAAPHWVRSAALVLLSDRRVAAWAVKTTRGRTPRNV
ncbi:MAG: FAD-dependent oxidoreductase [Acidobacteriota bacterium]|nr:FAD-dependent oxidoreductase [Acidobacteriota bacterium]